MNVSMTPELEKFIEEKIKSGHYQTASEVVREGLRLLMHQDEARERLRAEIRAGLDELDAGKFVDGEQVFAELRAKSRARRNG